MLTRFSTVATMEDHYQAAMIRSIDGGPKFGGYPKFGRKKSLICGLWLRLEKEF